MQPKSDFGDCKINKPVGCQVKGRKDRNYQCQNERDDITRYSADLKRINREYY